MGSSSAVRPSAEAGNPLEEYERRLPPANILRHAVEHHKAVRPSNLDPSLPAWVHAKEAMLSELRLAESKGRGGWRAVPVPATPPRPVPPPVPSRAEVMVIKPPRLVDCRAYVLFQERLVQMTKISERDEWRRTRSQAHTFRTAVLKWCRENGVEVPDLTLPHIEAAPSPSPLALPGPVVEFRAAAGRVTSLAAGGLLDPFARQEIQGVVRQLRKLFLAQEA